MSWLPRVKGWFAGLWDLWRSARSQSSGSNAAPKLSRRRFLVGVAAAALVVAAESTRLGRTLKDVLPKPVVIESEDITIFQSFYPRLGGRMYPDELSKVLRNALVVGRGVGKTHQTSSGLTFVNIEDIFK